MRGQLWFTWVHKPFYMETEWLIDNVLDWPIKFFGFSHKMLWKNPNKCFDQSNPITCFCAVVVWREIAKGSGSLMDYPFSPPNLKAETPKHEFVSWVFHCYLYMFILGPYKSLLVCRKCFNLDTESPVFWSWHYVVKLLLLSFFF